MASSEVEICKLAQAKIGNTNFFSALTDPTVEANVCSIEYPQARDVALERSAPPFATKRANLALLAETRSGWDYVYALPADFLAIQAISNSLGRFVAADLRELFDIEMAADNSGRVLLSNTANVEIIYVMRVVNVTKWPALFTEAVVYALASSLALSLKKDVNLAAKMLDTSILFMGFAHGSAQSQRNLGRDPDSEILRSRE